ncbi:MAG: hypothetical protein K2L21_03475 [Muribaculaceae bacterium]|nr:hypothetical protein [Muribaculaceae bacterium]
MKKQFTFIILMLCAFAAGAAPTAASLLEQCSAKLFGPPAVSASFTLRTVQGEELSGRIVMARESFRLTSPEFKIWFDGRTQWTALATLKEVNVTEPTAEELLSGNPFAIISGYAGRYNCRLLPQTKGAKPEVREVELTPRNAAASDIRRAVVSIDTRTHWPSRIVVTMASGATASATVSDCRTLPKQPRATFSFKASDLPGYEIVDLR